MRHQTHATDMQGTGSAPVALLSPTVSSSPAAILFAKA